MKKRIIKQKRKNKLKKERLVKLLTFLIKFNIFAIPFYLIIIAGVTWPLLIHVTEGIAFNLLRFIGVDASMSNGLIIVPVSNGNFAATVSWDSTGWKSMLAFFALVFATEFSLRKKLTGLLFLPIIYSINILRIVFMFFSVQWDITYFSFLHTTLWSWGLIATVLVLWFVWMRYIQ